jgi:hypothetical protein
MMCWRNKCHAIAGKYAPAELVKELEGQQNG